jgi:hypothetical protein
VCTLLAYRQSTLLSEAGLGQGAILKQDRLTRQVTLRHLSLACLQYSLVNLHCRDQVVLKTNGAKKIDDLRYYQANSA